MKILQTVLLIFSFTLSGFSQPDAIPFQTIVYDKNGNVLENHELSILAKIIQGSADGIVIYEETHNVSTNQSGAVSLEIGRGQGSASSISELNWSVPNYIELSIDINGGSNFSSLGKQELLSVPYAFYALTVEGESGCEGYSGPQGPTGPAGANGASGPAGVIGDTGAVGATGAKGPTGPTGSAGVAGSPGQVGDPGMTQLEYRNTPLVNPMFGEMYLDDGTNRADGKIGIRYFMGNSWLDL